MVCVNPFPQELQAKLPPRLARWAYPVSGVAAALFLDPLLIMAIMDRETLGGDACIPKGSCERGTGDGGNGLGLMQIDRRYHPTFAAALAPDRTPLWQKPVANIMYGALVLRAGVDRFKVEDAAVAAYNASAERVANALKGLAPDAGPLARTATLDLLTTKGNYVSDVLGRRAAFVKLLTGGPDAVS